VLITYLQHLSILDTLQGLGARLVRRQHGQFPDHFPRQDVDSDFNQAAAARSDEKHCAGGIALSKKDVSRLYAARRHEWLEPIHLEIALRRLTHYRREPEHFTKTQNVERQQYQVENQDRIEPVEISVSDEGEIAAYANDAQRHHCFHVERQKYEERGSVSGTFRDVRHFELSPRVVRFILSTRQQTLTIY